MLRSVTIASSLFFSFLLTHIVCADEGSELRRIERVVAASEKSRAEFVSQLVDAQEWLECAKRGRIVGSDEWGVIRGRVVRTHKSKDSKNQEIEHVEALVSKAKEQLLTPPVALSGMKIEAPSSDQLGMMTFNSGDYCTGSEVVQVVSETEVLLHWGDWTYWVSNLPTAGMIDGESIPLIYLFEYLGTKRYTTAIGGSKQVYHFTVIDRTEAAKFLSKCREAWVKQNLQDWQSGDHSCRAWASMIDAKNIVLCKADGSSTSIPIDKLTGKSRDDANDFKAKYEEMVAKARTKFLNGGYRSLSVKQDEQ